LARLPGVPAPPRLSLSFQNAFSEVFTRGPPFFRGVRFPVIFPFFSTGSNRGVATLATGTTRPYLFREPHPNFPTPLSSSESCNLLFSGEVPFSFFEGFCPRPGVPPVEWRPPCLSHIGGSITTGARADSLFSALVGGRAALVGCKWGWGFSVCFHFSPLTGKKWALALPGPMGAFPGDV